MRTGRFLLLFLLLLLPFSVKAQANWLNYTYTNFVLAIEHAGGDWWLGTEGGLVQFNENTSFLRVFNRGNSNIPGNRIYALSKDENDHLWMATEYGVAFFDGQSFTLLDSANSGLLNDHIKLLDYEPGKGLWVVTDSALSFYDGHSWTHYRQDSDGRFLNQTVAMYAVSPYGVLLAVNGTVEFLSHEGTFTDYGFTGSGFISGVGFDFANNVVVSTSDQGFWVSNNSGGWDHYTNGNTPMRTDVIYEMKCAPNGDIYFNHGQVGVAVWHSYDNTWNIIPGIDGDPLNYLTTVYAKGPVALGLSWPTLGLVVADHPDEWTYTFSDSYDLNHSPLHSNNVNTIIIKNGKKYVATEGIDILDTSDRLLRRYDWHNGDYFALINPTKYLAVDAWDNIWCSDDLNISLTKISGDRIWALNGDSLGIANPYIKALQWEDKTDAKGKPAGTLWVSVNGSDYDGIAYYDSLWHTFPNQHPQYPWGFKQFARDFSGTMWFAANGIYSYDGTDFVQHWNDAPLKQPTCVITDRHGQVWFGGEPDADYGWAGGLAVYDGNDWQHLSAQNSALPDDHITSLACDTLGNIWVGTKYGGLVKIDTTGIMHVFNRRNSPLDNNWIVKVAVDPLTNNIWVLNLHSGVFVYNEQGLTGFHLASFPHIPGAFALKQNYPNPFNPSTTIGFTLKKGGHVRLTIFDVRGRKVRTLIDDFKPAGRYSVSFDGQNLAGGVYFYRLNVGQKSITRKMILIK